MVARPRARRGSSWPRGWVDRIRAIRSEGTRRGRVIARTAGGMAGADDRRPGAAQARPSAFENCVTGSIDRIVSAAAVQEATRRLAQALDQELELGLLAGPGQVVAVGRTPGALHLVQVEADEELRVRL